MISGILNGQPGSLDLTFGTNGIATCQVGALNDDAQDMLIDPSGNIIVVGYSSVTSTDFDFSVARFTPAGVLDASFGTGGTTIINTGSGGDQAYSVALDGSGRIYIAGLIWNGVIRNLGIVRLTSNGLPDNSWDGDGVWFSQTLYGEYVSDIEIDANGKVVIAGHGGLNDDKLVVLRLTSAGAYDGTFGTGGRVELGASGNDEGMAIAFDANNNILIGAREEFTIFRLTPTGTLDAAFGTGGSITINPTANADDLNDIIVDANGKIVVMGQGGLTLQVDFIAARLNSNGTLDNTFGTSGITVVSAGLIQDAGRAIAIDANGKILLGGDSSGPNGTDFTVVRLNTNGTVDNTFGTNGVAIVTGTNADEGWGMRIDANGKIVIAGIGSGPNDNDFFVARLHSTAPTSVIKTNHSVLSSVYPNPAHDKITIRMPYNGFKDITILDGLGKNLVFIKGYEEENFLADFSAYPSGIYFISVKTEEFTQKFKVVKE